MTTVAAVQRRKACIASVDDSLKIRHFDAACLMFLLPAYCRLLNSELREWQVWGNLNPYPNDGSGSVAPQKKPTFTTGAIVSKSMAWIESELVVVFNLNGRRLGI